VDTELKETIVLDDIIPEDFQNYVHSVLTTSESWRFIRDMSYATCELRYPSYGFNMMFKHPGVGVTSELYEKLSVPLISYIQSEVNLEEKEIYFNRSFLQLPLDQKFIKEHNGIHVDIPQDHYACIYYVNDCDGETILYDQTIHNTQGGSKNVDLKEHKRVMPKKGRVVLFDGARYHCSSQPRESYRCIINFDLIKQTEGL